MKIYDKYLDRWIEYTPETGEVKGVKCEGISGGRHPSRQIYFEGKQIKLTIFIWFIMTGEWPTFIIDHKDRNSLNDAWDNLRPATLAQNARNRTKRKNSQWKFIGVTFCHASKWRYNFTIDNEIDCAIVRDLKVLELGDEFTVLNILNRDRMPSCRNLVDDADLKSAAVRRAGSSPAEGTNP